MRGRMLCLPCCIDSASKGADKKADMDDLVKQAMQKWPNVPHCYGWLGLDQRGDWYMRDDQTQSQGSFAQAKGSLLQHDKLIAFIQRNYLSDEHGQWYFQNGPHRVYVELQVAPWIWRLQPDVGVSSHTGRHAQVLASCLDEQGRLYLHTDLGLGLVHTLDMAVAADAVEAGRWQPEAVMACELPQRFGFVLSPQAVRT